ncbi:MAG: hypothetical protein AB7F25_02475 [Deferribacterales bacterium]
MRAAAIDIGSNAVRLMIADVEDGKIVNIVHKDRHVTKLAEVLSTKGILSNASIERTMNALRLFAEAMAFHKSERFHAVATSAVREARNSSVLIEAAGKLGINIQVIDGTTEAGLIFNGVCSAVDTTDKKVLVFDIGGGSTEFIYAEPGKDQKKISVPMGVVKLAERYDFGGALEMEQMDRIRIPMFSVLQEVVKFLECKPDMLIGSAGTPTTLAAIEMHMENYNQIKVNGFEIAKPQIEEILKKLCSMTAEKRLLIPGMEVGRQEVLIPGILITLELMSILGMDKLTVSDFGLREGLVVAVANA